MKECGTACYPLPVNVPTGKDFAIFVQAAGCGDWTEVFSYEVKVDMHDVRTASMAYFDFKGKVHVRIRFLNYMEIYRVDVRPKKLQIKPTFTEKDIFFDLEGPAMISIEVNGDRYHNLHLFAGEIEKNVPKINGENVLYVEGSAQKPQVHNMDHILKSLEEIQSEKILYFGPGLHFFEECVLRIPSNTSVYIAGGGVVVGSFVCDHVKNVRIYGRGVVYLAGFDRFCALRGVRVSHSEGIQIEGIIFINPPHYTIYVGESNNILIRDVKAFSCEGWSDGIDIMSSRNIIIEHVFLRNSDDCIALYGKRWDYSGDTDHILVKNSILWADVAHPINIGCHGDSENDGNIIENIVCKDLDILEHHEPQIQCMGCMCINAGDKNTVRNVRFEDIRIEHIEHGNLFDLRIICGKYNTAPGRAIENIYFKNIYLNCENQEEPSRISGGENGCIKFIVFENLVIRGIHVKNLEQGNICVGNNVQEITFI